MAASRNRAALAAAVACSLLALPAWADPLTAVLSGPANQQIKLGQIVNLGSNLVPIDAATIPGNSNLFVGTYVASSAQVLVINPATKTISPTPFLTFSATSVPIAGQGLQGMTFSPNFNDNTKPGYHKFYTYEAETAPASPATSILFRHPEVPSPAMVGVVREWTANAGGTAIDTSIASRVVFNFGTPAGHMGGGMKFGPDGLLYLATGDGGGNGDGNGTTSNSDGFTGRSDLGVPGISNGQDFTNVLGKVIRIDPYVTNADGTPRATPGNETAKLLGGSNAYFIPNSNPFVGNPQGIFFRANGSAATPVAPLPELFAIGFRNPWKLSFDKNAVAGAAPFVANVGSHEREEIDLILAGKDYGWPYREGEDTALAAAGRPLNGSGLLPFLNQTSSGFFSQAPAGPLTDPAQMANPVALLGMRSVSNAANLAFADKPGNDLNGDSIYGNAYGDGSAVVGGFVYRGSLIPELQGKYVFGDYQFMVDDPSRPGTPFAATSGGGRLFYFDPNEAATYKTIKEFNYDAGFGIANANIPGSFNNIGDLMGVVQGDNGDLYAMFVNGDIREILPSVSAVPEPASAILLGVGGLFLLRRRGRTLRVSP